jgi:hypothetical protein
MVTTTVVCWKKIPSAALGCVNGWGAAVAFRMPITCDDDIGRRRR